MDVNVLKSRLVRKDHFFELSPFGKMLVPARFFVNEELLSLINDDSLLQAVNVASLPGIVSASLAMPDMHQGYGFPIGGVAAFSVDDGVVSPGGIGFDINCGVRLLRTPLFKKDLVGVKEELINGLFNECPVGVGSESFLKLSDDDYERLLVEGSAWAVSKGFGFENDLLYCESNGVIKGANPKLVSPRAKKRGRKQLGTVGAGNHFVELQVVDEVFDETAARVFGLEKDQVLVLIHCGSRGLGHQVCTDYINLMEDSFEQNTGLKLSSLVDKNLIYAPIKSSVGKDYLSAMAAAANYAFANRQLLTHAVRRVFNKVLGVPLENISLVYDLAHNIAKFEKHLVNNEFKELLVHRKGATRAFPKGHEELPLDYQVVGQPVIVPGSMGTSSYLLIGTDNAMRFSFGSAPHGAGRLLSRLRAKKELDYEKVSEELVANDVFVKTATKKGLLEEAPQSYKDVDLVIKAIVDNGLAERVVRLKPLGVIKG